MVRSILFVAGFVFCWCCSKILKVHVVMIDRVFVAYDLNELGLESRQFPISKGGPFQIFGKFTFSQSQNILMYYAPRRNVHSYRLIIEN